MKDSKKESEMAKLLDIQQAEQRRNALLLRGQIRVGQVKDRLVDESELRILQQRELGYARHVIADSRS